MPLGGNSPADAVVGTSTADSLNISISVKFIGVIGCSASGKSTVAHHLACRLDSPLHPISTDDFFFEDVSMQLHTYEDYRCINYDAVARLMTVLAHAVPTVTVHRGEEKGARAPAPAARVSGGATRLLQHDWEERVQDAWWAQIRLRLPESETYRRVAPEVTLTTKAPVAAMAAAAAAAPAQSSSACAEADHAESHRNDESSGDDGDGSLCAHEAEEEERRRRSIAASAQRKERCGGTSDSPLELYSVIDERSPHAVVPLSRHAIIYVVWEGLTLLCNRLVNSYIDYAIDVQCDPETACLRRFFRTPRRHLTRFLIRDSARDRTSGPKDELQLSQQRAQAAVVAGVVRQVYRPRIEQVWTVRSREEQRADLTAALEREMQLEGWGSLVHVASSTASSSPACMTVRDALDLLSPSCFDPPRPSCVRRLAQTAAATALCGGSSGAHLQGEAGDAAGAEGVGNECSACWSADGLPTRAFQIFWESEFDDWLAATASLSPTSTAAALGWASLIHRHREVAGAHAANRVDEQRCNVNDSPSLTSSRQPTPSTDEAGVAYVNRILAQCGRLALLQSPSRGERSDALSSSEVLSTACKGPFAVGLGLEPQLGESGSHITTAASAATISSALAPFYYEFRYWFYFEVLYYHRIFRPLQAHRLRWRSVVGNSGAMLANGEGRCGESGGCGVTSALRAVPRPWWTIRNDRDVRGRDANELLTQVEYISAAIRATR